MLDPAEALQTIWELLDEQYQSEVEPAQEILQELTASGPIDGSNMEALGKFARACALAKKLMIKDHYLEFQLNQDATQSLIVKRLDLSTSTLWFRERQSYLKTHKTVPFAEFSEWISMMSKSLRKQDSLKQIPSGDSSRITDSSQRHQERNSSKSTTTQFNCIPPSESDVLPVL